MGVLAEGCARGSSGVRSCGWADLLTLISFRDSRASALRFQTFAVLMTSFFSFIRPAIRVRCVSFAASNCLMRAMAATKRSSASITALLMRLNSTWLSSSILASFCDCASSSSYSCCSVAGSGDAGDMAGDGAGVTSAGGTGLRAGDAAGVSTVTGQGAGAGAGIGLTKVSVAVSTVAFFALFTTAMALATET